MSNFNIMQPGYGSEEKKTLAVEKRVFWRPVIWASFAFYWMRRDSFSRQMLLFISVQAIRRKNSGTLSHTEAALRSLSHDFVLLKERLTHTVEKGGDRVELTAPPAQEKWGFHMDALCLFHIPRWGNCLSCSPDQYHGVNGGMSGTPAYV